MAVLYPTLSHYPSPYFVQCSITCLHCKYCSVAYNMFTFQIRDKTPIEHTLRLFTIRIKQAQELIIIIENRHGQIPYVLIFFPFLILIFLLVNNLFNRVGGLYNFFYTEQQKKRRMNTRYQHGRSHAGCFENHSSCIPSPCRIFRHSHELEWCQTAYFPKTIHVKSQRFLLLFSIDTSFKMPTISNSL